MTESLDKLKEILGNERLKELTDNTEDSSNLTNSKQIFCECKTLILRPNHAKLILPSDSMLEIEKKLKFLQHSDTSFKDLVLGCYWLVDDMYKFEQIGYTKEIDTNTIQGEEETQHHNANGLRYLACAECNLCPLGWFDSTTKNSYLYVW